MEVYVSGGISKKMMLATAIAELVFLECTSDDFQLIESPMDETEYSIEDDAEEEYLKLNYLTIPRRHHSTYHMLHTWLPT